ADTGGLLLRPFLRKTLEVLFEGAPEAAEDLRASVDEHRARGAEERARLVVPPAADVVATLAAHYASPTLGELSVQVRGREVGFDCGEWKSDVASRANDDGTSSLVTMAPGIVGRYDFVLSQRRGKRALIVRDAQHEYVFLER